MPSQSDFYSHYLKIAIVILVAISSAAVLAQSDRDGDGFTDNVDACPNRGNEGGLGTDDIGCPYYDADWDGVFDRDDDCVRRGNEYGFGIDADGCPLTSAATSTPVVTTTTPEVTPEITPEITQEPVAMKDILVTNSSPCTLTGTIADIPIALEPNAEPIVLSLPVDTIQISVTGTCTNLDQAVEISPITTSLTFIEI